MIDMAWITTTSSELLMVLLSGVGIFCILLIYTRLAGLRSFSKMSSFDFAITVAFGSIVASTVLAKDPALLLSAFSLAVLYGIQYAVSSLRRASARVENLLDNEPLLIMAGNKILSDHLTQARMTEADLKSKLRGAGISHPDQVLAVVLESTGDVSVIKACDDYDASLFEGVRGAEQLPISTKTSA